MTHARRASEWLPQPPSSSGGHGPQNPWRTVSNATFTRAALEVLHSRQCQPRSPAAGGCQRRDRRTTCGPPRWRRGPRHSVARVKPDLMPLNVTCDGTEVRRRRHLHARSTVAAICLAVTAPGTAYASVALPPGHQHGDQPACRTNRSPVHYSTGFEDGVGRQWHPRKGTTAPSGERFLGRFVNRSVILRLRNLPPHRAVELSADVLMIMSWDGSNAIDGPDVLSVAITKGRMPHHRPWSAVATFSNDAEPFIAGYEQTFPHPYPGSVFHPGLTGSRATGTLGYPDVSAYGGVGDATYRLRAVVPHRGSSLVVRVTSRNAVDDGVEPVEADESFGLDNVAVRLRGRRCH
jgi:hypothetical protein